MLEVSKKFQEEILKPDRSVSIDGTLYLGEDLEEHHIPEEAVVQNSLTIVDQFNNGKFGYGSVYVRNLSVKLDYTRCEDIEGKNINFSGAQIHFDFYLNYSDGTTEKLDLGYFLIDSARSTRKGNVLSIYAEDFMSRLDVPAEAMNDAALYNVYYRACRIANVHALTSEETFSAFPNGTMRVSYDTKQIQTARDMLMWVAELTGSYARVKTYDYGDGGRKVWALELAQTPTKYTKSDTPGNFDLETFKADNGTVISPDARYSTDFTDTSVRITTILMNVKGAQKKSHSNWTFAADTLEGTMEMKNNPLLDGKTDSAIQTAFDNIREYTDDLRFCPFKTTFIGSPAIECGDFVYLERGGDVDETNFRHYGIVTYSKWTYPNKHEIRCATDMTAERPDTVSEASAASVSGMARSAPRAASETIGVQPKSQLEKRIDALDGGSDRIISSNGSQLVIVPSAYSPGGAMAGDRVVASVTNGALDIRTPSSYASIYPGNTYVEGQDLFGNYTRLDISGNGIQYTHRDNGQNYISFSISTRTDSYGNQVGSIAFGLYQLEIRSDGLYINGNKVLTE